MIFYTKICPVRIRHLGEISIHRLGHLSQFLAFSYLLEFKVGSYILIPTFFAMDHTDFLCNSCQLAKFAVNYPYPLLMLCCKDKWYKVLQNMNVVNQTFDKHFSKMKSSGSGTYSIAKLALDDRVNSFALPTLPIEPI